MKYCTQCGSEYREGVTRCADCGGTELVTAAQMHQRGLLLPRELDERRFVVAGTAEDPLTSERFEQVLQNAQIPVFPRARRGGTVDNLSTPEAPWWEILVPEELLAKAAELIRQERSRIESGAEEAGRAAEEEEQEEEEADRLTSKPREQPPRRG